MRYRSILLLLLLCSCTKDTLLVEQMNVNVTAYSQFTDYCYEVYGVMLTEKEAIAYTGRFLVFTEEDFETVSYAESTPPSTCGRQVAYFDGTYVWVGNAPGTSPDYERQAFDGSPTKYLGSTFGDYIFSPPISLTFTSQVPYFLDADNILVGAFSYGTNTIEVYEANVINKTATGLGSAAGIPSANANPLSFFAADETMLMVVNEEGISTKHYVYTSSNLHIWEGPYLFGELIPFSQVITNITGVGDTFIATVTDVQTTPKTQEYWRSSDAGHTWVKLSPNYTLLHVQMLSAQLMYGVVKMSDGDLATISRLAQSTDSGTSWSLVEGDEFYGTRISFLDAKNGMATAGPVMQTTHDGGVSWKLVFIPPY